MCVFQMGLFVVSGVRRMRNRGDMVAPRSRLAVLRTAVLCFIYYLLKHTCTNFLLTEEYGSIARQ